MEAGSRTIFLCALFIFSAEGAPKFTKEPQNPSLVVEGDNITFEWEYTFGESESFFFLTIVKGNLAVVTKLLSTLSIPTLYQGRLHANITDSYASVTLLGVNRLEMGSYTLRVSSQPDGESNSSTVEISVLYLDKPDIYSTDMRPAEGTAVKISCIVDGQPTPTVSWTMNGSPLNTSGNSRIFLRNGDKQLNIMNLNRTDSGEYRCVVQNSRGNISSNASVLSVQYQPEIALNPLNATKVEGENITWSCNATGNPEPIISWIFYGSNINTTYNPRIVFSKGRQEMTITSIIRTDNGEYQCMASNMLGNVSSRVATLDVLYKPEISPLPRMIQRTEGEKMILFCNATGNPVPTISWIINGFSLDTNNSSRMNLSYEGKQLTIKNVRRTDSALYRCVAENSLGNVTSHNTTLEVHYIPGVTVIGDPQQFAIVGKVKKLLCKYDAVPPVSEVQWIKEGDMIARNTSLLVNESRLTVSLYNESQIQLLINQSTSHDAGNYTCLVINAVGNSSQKTSVISQELPLITIHPERKTPMQGEKITLSCNATGNPEPSISWVKDGSPINSNSRINFSQGNKRLTITNISRTDSGKYRCVARNRVGNDTLNSRVDVLFEPEVTIDGDHEQYVAKGSDIRLICRYDAFPPVSEVQWIKNGTAISGNTSRLISDSRVTISSFSKSQIQLTITAASPKDGGNYTCRVTNILNSTQDTTLITIVGILVKLVPDPPQNITVDTKGSRVINISWTVGFDGNCAIRNYTVEISQHDQILKDVVCQGSLSSSTCVVSRLSTTASLTGLFPWTTYNIRVFASNKIGRSNSSPILNVTTDEEVPSKAPNFIVTVLNSTAVNVSWQMLSKDIARGAVLGYYVLHRLNSTPLWINKTVDRAELTSLLVGPLNEHTPYEFAMQAFNSKGASHLSASVRKTTDQHKPSSTPQAVTVSATSSKSIFVSWDPVTADDRNGIIKGYIVNYQALPNGDIVAKILNITNEEQNNRQTVTLSNLNEFTNYSIGVLAFTVFGNGPVSVSQVVETLEDKPSGAPQAVTVGVTSSRSISVSWHPVIAEDRNGIIKGYRVNFHALPNTYAVTKFLNITKEQQNKRQTVTLDNLNEFTNYSIGVLAFTLLGNGPASVGQVVETLEDKPTGAPQAVTVSVTSSRSISISWDPVIADDRNGIVKGYKVNYQALPNGGIATEIFKITKEQQNRRQTVTLGNLNEFTNYSIGVLAFTVFGNGPASVGQVVETLEDKPSGAPQAVTVNVTYSRGISVSWDPVVADDRNGIIKGYIVNYQALPNGYIVAKILNITNDEQNNRQTVTLAGLNEFTNYSIGVLAFTIFGNGPASIGQVVETLKDIPSNAPQAVTVSATSSKSIFVSWDPVPADDRNGIIKGYKVNYQALPNGDMAAKFLNITRAQQNKRQTVTLDHLNEFTNYSIGVLAFTAFGNGPASVVQVVETLEDKPSNTPQAVTVSATSSRSISVSWDPIVADGRNGIIRGYIVNYQALPNGYIVAKILNITNEEQNYRQTVTLDNLNEFTNYSIGVLAFTAFGNGPASVVRVVETMEDKPGNTPQAVTVSATSSRSISVSWEPVIADDRNGIIKGYVVNYQALPNGYLVAKILNITNQQQNNRQTVTLAGLNEFTNYSIEVLAFTIFGNGPASVGQVVETLEDIPSNAPQVVTVSATSSKSIFVSWDPVIADDRNGIIKGYKVNYQALPNGDMAAKFLNITKAQQNKRQRVSLANLNEFTNYSIGVLAFTAFGNGPASVGQVVETLEDKPSRGAENVSFSEVNYTTNKITWAELPKEAANGVIKLYEVRLELKESCLKVDFTFHAMNTTKSSVLLTGFWMCAKYEVSVRGYTVAGPGPYSKAIVAQTKSLKLSQTWSKERPSPPSFSQIPSGEGITANITLPRFPGNAKFFQVIVIRYSLDYTGVVNSPESLTPKDLMTYEEAHKSPVPAAYITFQFRGQDFDVFRKFVVGDGGHSSSKPRNRRGSDGEVFLNKPLQPNTNYRVFLRAFIEKMVYFSSNFVTIETKGEPAVKDLPERTIFQVGDVVVLTCEATGDPKPSVTWSKNGNTSIPRAQFRNDDHILVIQEVAPSDGGIYECRASNVFGQRRTATAVIIAVPPSIMKDVSPRSVLCAKETSCSLLCHATSDILFNYSWTRNGQALDGHNIKVMNNSVVITPLDDQDFGDYVCHATNSFGSTTYKITLSESRMEENNVQSIFRASDIAWSCIVFVLLFFIGVLIWRLKRAQASNRPATAKKATSRDTVQSAFPLEQHASELGSYMELRPRPSQGQTRVPPEYQSLQGSHVNAGYYNVVPEEGNKRGSNEEIYEEIQLSDC